MLGKIIREIPPHPIDRKPRKVRKLLRVAAYCRVSTEEEEQKGSFETQCSYYTEKIQSHDGWTLAGIFADDGISGVHTKKRDDFLAMIAQCKKGKIDLILTKSISRFARNTLDSIQYVRELKKQGIFVIFEKENINTGTMTSEMILTVLSAFAQAESESISQNVARGKRMGYRQGKFSFPYSCMIGYRKGPDGNPQIIPEQAETVRLIYNDYLAGDSLKKIAENLDARGIPTPKNKGKWSSQTVMRILQNEKYAGHVLLQKTYTADLLSGTIKKNNGELPQYYIENNHTPIVSQEMFLLVQEEIARRKSKSPASQKKVRTNRGRYTSQYAFSERLICGECGCYYRRVTWNIRGKKKIVWRCINRLEFGKKYCKSSPSISEDVLHNAILRAIRELAQQQKERTPKCLNDTILQCATGGSDTSLTMLKNQLEQKNRDFARFLEMALTDGAESEFVEAKMSQLNDEILCLKQKIKQTEKDATTQQASKGNIKKVFDILLEEHEKLTEYNDSFIARIIERVTVENCEWIIIRFIGGQEMCVEL
ncbi:recombinase family protein [Ruthenibacterium lactatiformans]|uniref:recombinase family protein n=1 Tax=Ruthenibacterium lactatiformans TaxID=1550024 RepID=UPI001967722B|nr:recombinase family protein [Ruthenibacterium lactatiformans]MBN3018220.1 recombinase family protein [Ruthenibacterium lactatiformans]